MATTVISNRLKKLHEDGFWLYVDDSEESREAINEMEPFTHAGMVVIADLTQDGGFSDGAKLPRLVMKYNYMTGQSLRHFIAFLKELNQEFLEEETAKAKVGGS